MCLRCGHLVKGGAEVIGSVGMGVCDIVQESGVGGIILGFNFLGGVGGPVLFFSGWEQHRGFVNKSRSQRWTRREILN